jgi:galactokinase
MLMNESSNNTAGVLKQYASVVPDSLHCYIKENSVLVRSPGRINLIGEHTDYNNGFVLPAAIDKAVYMVVTPRRDKEIRLLAVDLDDQYVTDAGNIQKSIKTSWPNYLLGVVEQFVLAGANVKGFEAVLTADIPIGAGLSSSAAVECAMALALNELFEMGFDRLTLVKMAQKAENHFVGVQCGIMDQFASMFGRHDQVIRLDCRSLEYAYVPFSMDGIKIVLLDTNVKHTLGTTQYNDRRIQCETGVALIRKQVRQVKSLRDVNMEMLDQYVLKEDTLIYNRCKYVVEENNRLLQACEYLENRNIPAFGKKMFETHDGLSKLYQVSCAELDFLVSHVKTNPAVLGARMMGGGFGGCTINLVKEEAIDDLIKTATHVYALEMNKPLKVYIAKIEAGTSLIKVDG